jgi:hypothetical protein
MGHMRFINSIRALVVAVVFAAAISPARADIPAATLSSGTSVECAALSPDEARRLAIEASKDGAHRRAAECFRAAGDPVQADRAQIRASADSSAAAAEKVATTIKAAKLNAQRLRAAFRKDRT